MAYKISFKKSVAKDLKRLSPDAVDRILTKLVDELPQKAEHLPGLQGQYAGLKKYRIGEYRVIFSILDNSILILKIQHRKDVYR